MTSYYYEEKKVPIEETTVTAYPGEKPPPYVLQDVPGNNVIVVDDVEVADAAVAPFPSTIKSKEPVFIICPNCGKQVQTNIAHKNGVLTWLLAGLLCIFGCSGGCCLIPFCVKDCKDVVHICPECEVPVGRYRKLEL